MTNFRLSASAIVLAAAISVPAYAQDEGIADGTSQGVSDGNVIVVTGSVLQNQRGVAEKGDADIVADFLVSDEIGRQPDFNIADAFRRAPGITTVFDEDEGRAVGIRGLSPAFTVTKVEGATIATSERNIRQTNLEIIPASAVGQLNIYKSRTAASEGNAIGGTIELQVRSAFDVDDSFVAASFAVGGNDNQDVPGEGFGRNSDNGLSFRAEGIATKQFADGTLGVVLSGNYLKRRRDQQRFIPFGYSIFGDTPLPSNFRYFGYPNTIERFGGQAKVEWRPSDAFEANFLVSRFEQQDTELRNRNTFTTGGVVTPTGSNAATFTEARSRIQFNSFFIDKPNVNVIGNATWRPAEGHVLKVRASRSTATNFEPSRQIFFQTPFTTELSGTASFDASTGIPLLTLDNPAAAVDGSLAPFGSSQFSTQTSDDAVNEYGADYGYNTQPGDYGFGFDIGAQFRSNLREFDVQSTTATLAAGNTLTLENFILRSDFMTPFQNQGLAFIDAQGFEDFRDANGGLFNITESNTSGDYSFDEDVTAAYGQIAYRGDNFYVNAGVRYERTETSVTRLSNGAFATAENSYSDFLPSISGWVDLADNIKLRGAYYKAIGRPDPIDLAGAEAITIDTITRGNIDLEARQSDNFDASLEYYLPGSGGLFAVSAFYKDISNDIFRFTDDETINGQVFEVNTPRNAGSSSLRGVELSLVLNSFDFIAPALEGFGMNSNFTYIDGELDVTGPGGTLLRTTNLIQQPETIFNVAAFWQSGAFETRMVYNRTGSVLTSIATSDVTTNDRFNEVSQRLDWSARYDISDNIEISAEVRNLTNEPTGNFQSTAVGRALRDRSVFGRTFFAQVSFNF